jgi:hypothetical protein
LTIERFASRVRLPYPVPSVREQLAATTDRLLGGLPDVLDGWLPPSVRICIRSLGVRIRVSAHAFGDIQALSQVWAQAIITAIKDAYPGDDQSMPPMITSGAGHVVIYRNDAAALSDLVESAACADHARRWAWRQLGMIDDDVPADPVHMIISGCRSLPQVALPVLANAARRGWLDRIVITWSQWQQLAGAALPRPRYSQTPWVISGHELIIKHPAPMLDRVRVRLQLSPLKSIMIRTVGLLGPPPTAAQPQLAELALAAGTPELDGTSELIMVAARQLFASEVRSDSAAAIVEPAPPSDHSYLVPEPVQLWTRSAGLLFLLNLQAIRRLAEDPPDAMLGHRPLSRTLVAIGHRLTGAAIDDPAILAFAGLPPAGPVPREILEPPAPADDGALDVLADQIHREFAERLPRMDLPVERLVTFVIARSGRIVADPGCIELIMPLDSVDLELRRAGLDLDPGLVGFIGCVVRFRYE